MRGLKDKVAIVTGSASGIGKATAIRLAEEGVKQVIADINVEAGEQVAAEIRQSGMDCVFVACDVGDSQQIATLVNTCKERYGRIDILVNNAGVGTYGKTPNLDPEQWHHVLNINLNSIFYACRLVIPIMQLQGKGSIINTASVSGLFGDYGLTAYNAAKGAVVNYTRSMALDHGYEGIRVNAVCPGSIETGLTTGLYDAPGIREQYRAAIPLRRTGQPHEIAAAIAFLASDDASYISGANLVIDGAQTVDTGQPNISMLLNDE